MTASDQALVPTRDTFSTDPDEALHREELQILRQVRDCTKALEGLPRLYLQLVNRMSDRAEKANDQLSEQLDQVLSRAEASQLRVQELELELEQEKVRRRTLEDELQVREGVWQ